MKGGGAWRRMGPPGEKGVTLPTPDIVLTRIDNRLVHGQVGAAWTVACGANLLVVANDEASQDKMMQSLMSMTAKANGVGIRFFSIQKTIDVIGKASPRQHIFLVVQNPQDLRRIVEGGVPIKEVNIGNMHVGEGKHTWHEPHVYVDDQDLADFKAMADRGVKFYIQLLPTDKRIENLGL